MSHTCQLCSRSVVAATEPRCPDCTVIAWNTDGKDECHTCCCMLTERTAMLARDPCKGAAEFSWVCDDCWDLVSRCGQCHVAHLHKEDRVLVATEQACEDCVKDSTH